MLYIINKKSVQNHKVSDKRKCLNKLHKLKIMENRIWNLFKHQAGKS